MKKTLIITVLLFAVAAFSFASETLSVSRAVELALANSSEAFTAANTLQMAVNSSKTSSLIPSFSLSSDINENVDCLDFSSTRSPSISVSGGVSWSLKTSSIYEKIASDLSLENSELQYLASLNNIANETVKSYWNLVSLENSVRTAQNSYNTTLANYNRTLELYNASKATKLSLSQAEISLKESSINLETVKSSFETAKKDFAETLGLDSQDFVLEKLPEVGNLDIAKIKEISKADLANSVSLRKAKSSLDITRNSVESAKYKSILPSVSLSINAKASSDVRNNKFTLGTTGNVNISVPLDSYIPGTSGNAEKKNNLIKLEEAERSYSDTVENIYESVDSLISSLEDKLSLVDSLKEYVSLAEENLRQLTEAYNEGFASYSELNSANTTYSNACSSLDGNTIQIINYICSLSNLIDVDAEQLMELTK